MQKIGIIADASEIAQKTFTSIQARYSFVNIADGDLEEEFSVILVLGGDGFMLRAIHRFLPYKIPLYGINCGTVGFLLNQFNLDNLLEKLEKSVMTEIHPLSAKIILCDGSEKNALAFNDVSLLRETRQSAQIKISIDGTEKLSKLIGDGILVSTPAGSSAYNFSVRGPIIPLSSDLLALTPIAPFRPRQWRGALLPGKTKVKFEVIDAEKRPVSAVVDFFEQRNIRTVETYVNVLYKTILLFDHENPLEEKILMEQFEM